MNIRKKLLSLKTRGFDPGENRPQFHIRIENINLNTVPKSRTRIQMIDDIPNHGEIHI